MYAIFVAEMIKPRISNFGENDFFHFLDVSKSDFVLTNFYFFCKDVRTTEPCNLHDLYSCIDNNERFHTLLNVSLF